MIYNFERLPEDRLIIVGLKLNSKYEFRMALDTGCTHTTIDSNALYLSGYELKDSIGLVDIETANGIVETEVFEIKTVYSLGISKQNFQIQVYDFVAHGIFSNYDGLLGLDFLDGKKFCIDTNLNQITINEK